MEQKDFPYIPFKVRIQFSNLFLEIKSLNSEAKQSPSKYYFRELLKSYRTSCVYLMEMENSSHLTGFIEESFAKPFFSMW